MEQVLLDPERVERVHEVEAHAKRSLRLDYICAQAAALLDTPLVELNLMDDKHQIYLAGFGHESDQVIEYKTFDYSLCQYVIVKGSTVVIEDACAEVHLSTNLAVRENGIRAYLGEPIKTPDGLVLGSFCAVDFTPRAWTKSDELILRRMAQLSTAALLVRDDPPQIENRTVA